jgi:hypothetical protein
VDDVDADAERDNGGRRCCDDALPLYQPKQCKHQTHPYKGMISVSDNKEIDDIP